jgi:chlorobactene glucosyltransferase
MLFLAIFTTLALIGITLIAIVNAFTLPRLTPLPLLPSPHFSYKGRSQGESRGRDLISILIPARDEAAVIEQSIRSLLTQTYLDYEIILLDDHSADGTAELARTIGQHSPRLRVVAGLPLPAGWLGKNWACHQLAQQARGDWLVFTDADVCWVPNALSALAAELERSRADLLAVWPSQHSRSWGERLVVPLMAFVLLGYLPLPLAHATPWSIFAAANGQCLAFRRRAYELIGGHTSVRGEVLEDVLLARRLKAHGLRLRIVDGDGLITCRMYTGWPAVRDGFAKNILAGYGGRVSLLLAATLFHWLILLLPWLWLALGWLLPALPGWPFWPLALIGLGLGVRALTAAMTRQRLADALLLPLSALLMTWIAGQAIWWQWRYGGPRWKGRSLALRQETHG